MIVVNVFQGFGAKFLFELYVLSGSLFLISQYLMILVLGLLFLLVDLVALADIVDPVSKVDDVHGICRILANIFELFVIFQLEKLVIVIFGEILEVDICKASQEIFTFVVEESLLFENFPIVLRCRLIVKNYKEFSEQILENSLLLVRQLGKLFRLHFGN